MRFKIVVIDATNKGNAPLSELYETDSHEDVGAAARRMTSLLKSYDKQRKVHRFFPQVAPTPLAQKPAEALQPAAPRYTVDYLAAQTAKNGKLTPQEEVALAALERGEDPGPIPPEAPAAGERLRVIATLRTAPRPVVTIPPSV